MLKKVKIKIRYKWQSYWIKRWYPDNYIYFGQNKIPVIFQPCHCGDVNIMKSFHMIDYKGRFKGHINFPSDYHIPIAVNVLDTEGKFPLTILTEGVQVQTKIDEIFREKAMKQLFGYVGGKV